MSCVSWVAILAGVIAVAISSRTIGRPVWWLGPPTDAASPLFLLLLVGVVALPPLAWFVRLPSAPRLDMVCAVLLIGIAIPDFPSRPGTAAAMLVIGIAAFGQSIAVRVATRHYR